MKKYGFLLLTIACLTVTLTGVSTAETGSQVLQPVPAAAPSAAPVTAPVVENAKPETMLQKAENALEKTEEKIKDAAEKVKEKTEEIMEGKKPEPVKAKEETKPKESALMEETIKETPAGKTKENPVENAEEAEKTPVENAEETEKKPAENAGEKLEENAKENSDMDSDENSEEKTGGKDAEPLEDAESEPSDEEEINVTEGTLEIPEIMPEDALIRACILHWLCHLNQHAHCWGPNCIFGHSDASSPIRRENSIEEMLPNYCIGVLTSPIPEALCTHFGLRPYEGLWVEHVLPGSPAAEAGIQRGDILLRATIHDEENGEKIKKVFWLNHPILLMDLVEQIGPEEIELTTICNGKEQKINLTPTERRDLMEKAGIRK